MAIPTMFHFSRLTEVSMQSPNETASTSGGECEEQPVIQIRALEEHQTEDVGKPRVGECHTSIFSCKEDSSIQSVRTNRSLSDASRTSSEEKTKATACSLRKHPRKRSKDLRKLWRTSREEDDGLKSLKDTGSRRRNAQRNNSFFQRSQFFSITEHSSRPQQISQDRPPDLSDFRNNFWDFHHESCLRLHRLDLNLPSAVESQSILSDRLETNSTFIYAESIKCKNSCSIFSEDGQDLMSAWNGRSQDLYISGEEKSGSDVSGCSTQATAGSEYSGRSNGHLETFIDIDGCIYKDCSLAEAEWGSASSDSSDGSFCSPDKDSESWFYTSNKHMKPLDLDSCVLDNPCVPPDLHPEEFVPGQLKSQEDFRPDAVEDLYRDVEDKMNLQSCFSEFGSHEDSRELEGIVIQTERSHFSDIFCEMVKVATQEKVTGKVNINEGFLFHPRQFLQTKSSRYREGLEYSVLRHIQNGSYGDVFSIRDKQTGFTCAAKKIPLCSFRWEEVETWSRLNDPHVLQLFGAVREGPNVMLFMDLKRGSLAQVLRMKGHISEGLALYYHSQMVQALEHLHMRRVVHLDVKADNVLLSEDGRQCFLCDFGLSEMLSDGGYSTKTFRGNVLRGTESHMPPEVARGDRPSAKADVWSSCCMLLHMLNGHQPWTRNFPHPLYLKIVSEPPPLGEIPSNCDPLTFDVIKAGLVKDPRERHSASELLQKTMKALRTVCGLSNPVETVSPAFEDWPNLYHISSPPATQRPPESSVIATAPGVLEDLCPPMIHWVSTWRERAAHEDDSDSPALDSEEESEWEEPGDMTESNQDKMTWMERFWGTEKRTVEKDATFKLSKESDIWGEDIPMIEKCNDEASAEERTDDATEDHLTEKRVVFGDCGENDRGRFLEETESFDGEFRSFVSYEESDEEVESDLESLRELGKDWTQEEWEPFLQIQTLYPPLDPQTQSDVTYTDSDDESVTLMKSEEKDVRSPDSHKQQAVTDLCDSEQDLSEEDSDEMSSGVFSSCSTTDTQSFNVNWSVSTNQTSSCYLEGLGVDIWVEDVSGESLKIRERPQVKIGHIAVGISEQMSMRVFSLATLDGRLVSPDTEVCESGMWLQCVPAPDGSPSWDWRVRDGKLELQESDRYSDICSTLPL